MVDIANSWKGGGKEWGGSVEWVVDPISHGVTSGNQKV